MLYVEHKIPPQQLKRMRHQRLKNLIRSYLVNPNLLPENYLNLLEELQELREYANYPFGEDVKLTTGGLVYLNLKETVSKLYKRTEIAFDSALEYIYQVDKIISNSYDLLQYVRLALADVIGEDLYQTYLSKNDEELVANYLVQKGLTY